MKELLPSPNTKTSTKIKRAAIVAGLVGSSLLLASGEKPITTQKTSVEHANDNETKQALEVFDEHAVAEKIAKGAKLAVINIEIIEELNKGGEKGNATRSVTFPIVSSELARNAEALSEGKIAFTFYSAQITSKGKPYVEKHQFNPDTMSIMIFGGGKNGVHVYNGSLEIGDNPTAYYSMDMTFIDENGQETAKGGYIEVAKERILLPDGANTI